jgi:hypothetical protein
LHKPELRLLLADFGPSTQTFGLHIDSAADSLEQWKDVDLQNNSVCFVPSSEVQLQAMLGTFLLAYAQAPCSTEAHFVVPTQHLVETDGQWFPPWAAYDGIDTDWLSRVKCISLSKEYSVVYAPPLAVKHTTVKLNFVGPTGAARCPRQSHAFSKAVQGFKYTGKIFGTHARILLSIVGLFTPMF